jgi:hypothetical protein
VALIYQLRPREQGFEHDPNARNRTLHSPNLCQKDLNAEWALSSALGAIAGRRSAKTLFFSWPNLQGACLRLSGFLTNHYPGERRTLLEESLATAMQRYETAADDRRCELAPARAFLLGLIEHAPRLLDYRVYGICRGNRTVCWDSFSRPVSIWARDARVKRLVFEPTTLGLELKNTRFVHYLLASQVVQLRDLLAIKGEIESFGRLDATPPGD